VNKPAASPTSCQSPVVVALDYPTASDAEALVEQLNPRTCRLKVGKQLFTIAGPAFVSGLAKRGFDVFLDLKFHDIPNTVSSACVAAADLGVWMVNVHASGGSRMMVAAREALAKRDQAPLLIGVSVLTSLTAPELQTVGVARSVEDQVLLLSTLAQEAGLDGMVCSAHEASALKQRFGPDFALVTPGIRTADADHGDQRRVMTPEAAMAAGADYLVIGRAISAAANPAQVLAEINASLGVTA